MSTVRPRLAGMHADMAGGPPRRAGFVGRWLLSAAVWLAPTALALAEASVDAALERVEQVDGEGRWFSYSIALAGAAAAIGSGGWALLDAPLADRGGPDPWVVGGAALLVGAGLGQIVHGGMRFDERGNSARTIRGLLDGGDDAARRAFLVHRAAEARDTRWWGGVITTAQGVGMSALGARLWMEGEGGVAITGAVFTGLGALTVGVGALHFFGRPRAERELDAAITMAPAILPGPDLEPLPGLTAGGRF